MWKQDKPKRQDSPTSSSNTKLDESLKKSISINASMQSMISLMVAEEGLPMDHILELQQELASALDVVSQQKKNLQDELQESRQRLHEKVGEGKLAKRFKTTRH